MEINDFLPKPEGVHSLLAEQMSTTLGNSCLVSDLLDRAMKVIWKKAGTDITLNYWCMAVQRQNGAHNGD